MNELSRRVARWIIAPIGILLLLIGTVFFVAASSLFWLVER